MLTSTLGARSTRTTRRDITLALTLMLEVMLENVLFSVSRPELDCIPGTLDWTPCSILTFGPLFSVSQCLSILPVRGRTPLVCSATRAVPATAVERYVLWASSLVRASAILTRIWMEYSATMSRASNTASVFMS